MKKTTFILAAALTVQLAANAQPQLQAVKNVIANNVKFNSDLSTADKYGILSFIAIASASYEYHVGEYGAYISDEPLTPKELEENSSWWNVIIKSATKDMWGAVGGIVTGASSVDAAIASAAGVLPEYMAECALVGAVLGSITPD